MRPSLSDLLPAPFEDGAARSPEERLKLIAQWRAELEGSGLLNGYDRNVLRQWERADYSGPRPELSIELNAPYAAAEALASAEREAGLARQQLRFYEQWLQQGEQRSARERDRRLRREYPQSYLVFLQEEERLAEQALREQRERLRQQYLQAEQARKEKEELQALQDEMARERRALHNRAMRYAQDPLAETLDLSEGEFTQWCETIASPEELEAMTEALAAAGRMARLPAWQRWLERQAAVLLS